MRTQLERLSLLWALLLSPWLGAAENTAAVFVVNQTPPSIRAMEGSEFTIECTFNTSNNSTKWFAAWYKTRNNVTEKLSNGTDRIRLSEVKEKRSLSLTVRKADITDSGTYVCWVGSKDGTSRGNGTQVTIDEITDLMVNQTPTSVSDFEGSEFTMNCTFKTVNNHSTMYVRWYNYGTEGLKKELVNESDVLTTLHLDNGFASLTLKNANSSDTGTYVCEVGITARNLSGNGTGTQVTIETVDLLVNQSPACVKEEEGKKLTIECRFRALEKPSTKYSVKWYKNGTDGDEKELKNETGSVTTTLDFSTGLASLTLTKASVSDSGFYRCDFGKNGRGNGTRVTIQDKRSNASHVVFVIRMVLGALVIISAVMIVAECVISEKRAGVNRTI
ncbi:immunoglobulin superfamily member 3-like isoform X4 [Chrysemys picta bellii]|uniref:immunoglobulin superfamily member 3-like isoform X4 n=1 Tax=Chrysemys picta bellii TaxID=8478 RepID=UPI0032B19992